MTGSEALQLAHGTPAGLLDADGIRGLVDTHLARPGHAVRTATIGHVALRARDDALVGWWLEIDGPDGVTDGYVTARVLPRWRIDRELQRLAARPVGADEALAAFATVLDGNVLLTAFPGDRVLRDALRIVRPSWVGGIVARSRLRPLPEGARISKRRSAWQLVGYRPERRAVVRWRLATTHPDHDSSAGLDVFVRLDALPRRRHVVDCHERMARAGLRCPRLIGTPHDFVTVETAVDGVSWDGATRSAGLVGAVLARLHDIALPDGLHNTTPIDELDIVLRISRDLARLDPVVGERAFAVAARLARRTPRPDRGVLLHGAPRPDSFRLGDVDAGLVGFRALRRGHPARDLGALAGALTPDTAAAVMQHVTDGYAAIRPLPDPFAFAWFTVAATLCGAREPYRRGVPDRHARAIELVDRAASHAAEIGL